MLLSIYWLLASSFTAVDKGSFEYIRLQKLEQRALQKAIRKTYVYDLTGRKDCNKTKIKYLGIVHTKQGKGFKILTSFFVFSASATCHGTSSIKIFDLKNKYVGEYYVSTADDLPDMLLKNKLLYLDISDGCNLRKGLQINFENGLPKTFFVPCSKAGGDLYNFSSGY
jgi:hypothetical protein